MRIWLLVVLFVVLAGCGLVDGGADGSMVADGGTAATVTVGTFPTVTTVAASPAETATALPVPTETAPPTETASPTGTATAAVTATAAATPTPERVTFAVIGDYGLAGEGSARVSALIDSWEPEFIITVGDNNYPSGEAETIDENIGQYYAEYIYPYQGAFTTTTVEGVNRFFPSLGNHDISGPDGMQPYLDYFTLPGNERYYDFVWGPVHLFALNSDFGEPDGISANSVQGQWLQEALAASTAPWKVVYMHVPPYSSGHHGEGAWMRWPFGEWGASVVMAGHDHHYERLEVNGLTYFINGLGVAAIYAVREPVAGSQVRFTGQHGALRVEASAEEMRFEFVTVGGEVVDVFVMGFE